MEEKEYFRLYKIEKERLESYGFKKQGNNYIYSINIMNNELKMIVEVDEANRVNTKILDVFSEEEYILHRIKKANGDYISKVKDAYQIVLEDIRKYCASKEIFKNETTKKVIGFVKEKYNDQLEFLWKEESQSAVFRRKDVNKWYGIIMAIPKSKLGYESDEIVEVMNLKGDAMQIIDHIHYFPAYHMNKKTWYTIDLTSDVTLAEIKQLIQKSYESLKKS